MSRRDDSTFNSRYDSEMRDPYNTAKSPEFHDPYSQSSSQRSQPYQPEQFE